VLNAQIDAWGAHVVLFGAPFGFLKKFAPLMNSLS
jgi:hypothetical protein